MNKRPLHRLPLCWLRLCGGRVESNKQGLWWQCGTCQRSSGFTDYQHVVDAALRDRDASLAEDAKRLSGEAVAARAEGIAKSSQSPPSGPEQ